MKNEIKNWIKENKNKVIAYWYDFKDEKTEIKLYELLDCIDLDELKDLDDTYYIDCIENKEQIGA